MLDITTTLQGVLDRINTQQEQINFLSRLESIGSNPTATFNDGAVLFTDVNGQITADRDVFYFDYLNSTLELGPRRSFNGVPKLALFGNTGGSEAANLETYIQDDAHPLFQLLSANHDEVHLVWDAYWNGTVWKSSDAGSNYLLSKSNDVLTFYYRSAITAGDTIASWLNSLTLDTNGRVGIQELAPDAHLQVTFTGGSKTGIHIEDNSANADTLLKLSNPTTDIGGGSYFIRAQRGSTDRFYVLGTGRAYVDGGIEASSTDGQNAIFSRSGQTTRHIGIAADDTFRIARSGVADDISIDTSGNVNIVSGVLRKGGTQVVSSRRTGWGTPTGTLYRTALTNASTQTQFNQAIMAVITDLVAHGLIGA